MILTELILTHYSEPGRLPLRSVTALPEDEAMRLAAELAPTTRSPKNRFCAEDFPGYYAERMLGRSGGLAGLLAQAGVHYVEAQLWQTEPPTELVLNERSE